MGEPSFGFIRTAFCFVISHTETSNGDYEGASPTPEASPPKFTSVLAHLVDRTNERAQQGFSIIASSTTERLP